MLMIRFQRIGRTNDPAFRIVVLEKERAAKAGNILELLGTYNPHSKALTMAPDRVTYWISQGAQPTDSIHNLLINKGIIEGKKVNVLPKKSPIKKEGGEAPVAAPVVEAAPEVADETTETPEAPSLEEVAQEAEPAPVAETIAETPSETVAESETPTAA